MICLRHDRVVNKSGIWDKFNLQISISLNQNQNTKLLKCLFKKNKKLLKQNLEKQNGNNNIEEQNQNFTNSYFGTLKTQCPLVLSIGASKWSNSISFFFFLSNLLFLSTSVSTVLVFSYPALFQCISMMQCYFSSFGPPLVIIYTSLMHFYLTLIFELFFLMYFVFNVKLIIYSTSYHTMGITINLYYFL